MRNFEYSVSALPYNIGQFTVPRPGVTTATQCGVAGLEIQGIILFGVRNSPLRREPGSPGCYSRAKKRIVRCSSSAQSEAPLTKVADRYWLTTADGVGVGKVSTMTGADTRAANALYPVAKRTRTANSMPTLICKVCDFMRGRVPASKCG